MSETVKTCALASAVEPDPLQKHWDALRNRDVAATNARIDAKRAAVEPSCVVTDDGLVALAADMIRDACHDATGANINGPAVERGAKRIVAALSSRTEEEVQADERERLARHVEQNGFHAWLEGEFDLNAEGLAKWLRSLTNGGE